MGARARTGPPFHILRARPGVLATDALRSAELVPLHAAAATPRSSHV